MRIPLSTAQRRAGDPLGLAERTYLIPKDGLELLIELYAELIPQDRGIELLSVVNSCWFGLWTYAGGGERFRVLAKWLDRRAGSYRAAVSSGNSPPAASVALVDAATSISATAMRRAGCRLKSQNTRFITA